MPHHLLQGDNRAAKVRVIERISTFEDRAPFAGYRDQNGGSEFAEYIEIENRADITTRAIRVIKRLTTDQMATELDMPDETGISLIHYLAVLDYYEVI